MAGSDRLRAITGKDRLAEAVEKLERGETVDWKLLNTLQLLDTATAGRAALLDALDREEAADGELERILGD